MKEVVTCEFFFRIPLEIGLTKHAQQFDHHKKSVVRFPIVWEFDIAHTLNYHTILIIKITDQEVIPIADSLNFEL